VINNLKFINFGKVLKKNIIINILKVSSYF
jgi:hypothetical protein